MPPLARAGRSPSDSLYRTTRSPRLRADVGVNRTLVPTPRVRELPSRLELELRFLDQLADAVQEPVAGHAVDHAVIVRERQVHHRPDDDGVLAVQIPHHRALERSEERRVGKEGRSRWSPYH